MTLTPSYLVCDLAGFGGRWRALCSADDSDADGGALMDVALMMSVLVPVWRRLPKRSGPRLSAWQDFYDSTYGDTWTKCAGEQYRNNPCACQESPDEVHKMHVDFTTTAARASSSRSLLQTDEEEEEPLEPQGLFFGVQWCERAPATALAHASTLTTTTYTRPPHTRRAHL
eukprot:1195822-Prorocentrum_minimum.AAC.10